jgi:predicted TIM-barrel fold metal-dependent hydrolase
MSEYDNSSSIEWVNKQRIIDAHVHFTRHVDGSIVYGWLPHNKELYIPDSDYTPQRYANAVKGI